MAHGPWYRHITTCLPCGFREATKAGNAYAERCPGCGGPVEHYETMIQDRDELVQVDRPARVRMVAA